MVIIRVGRVSCVVRFGSGMMGMLVVVIVMMVVMVVEVKNIQKLKDLFLRMKMVMKYTDTFRVM